jgi:hypothetical protein
MWLLHRGKVSRLGATIYLKEGNRKKRGRGTKPSSATRILYGIANDLAKHTALPWLLAQIPVRSQPNLEAEIWSPCQSDAFP